MHHRPLFFTQAFVLLLVGILHVSAMYWYLYWYYPWLDLLTHFLGGLWVMLAIMWIFRYASLSTGLFRSIGTVMVIGICWEVFEFLSGIPREANFVFDTSFDLAMDFAGGIAGYVLGVRVLQSGAHSLPTN